MEQASAGPRRNRALEAPARRGAGTPSRDGDDDAIVEGTLRAPWKWETLIVESAVIGGDPPRWHRRLGGLANEMRLQRDAERRTIPIRRRRARHRARPQEPRPPARLRAADHRPARRVAGRGRRGGNGSIASPRSRRWCCGSPSACCACWSSCGRWPTIGPVVARRSARRARRSAADARDRAAAEPLRPRVRRQPAPGARARRSASCSSPGLAERMFPQRPHEDPLLLDEEMREPLDAGLADAGRSRAARERLLLRLAVGAPTERLWLSYPRLEVAESRPRVPSFYALDVMRAITGRIPQPQRARRTRAPPKAGAGSRGRRPRAPPTRSTISSTTCRCSSSCSRPSRRRRSAATRTTCCG